MEKVSYSIGLRGEYTYAAPKTNKSDKTETQRYFELFPSANLMFPLGEKHAIILNYNRKIMRPSFSQLNPFRLPSSEYLYIEGNPKLKPSLSNDYSIAFRLFERYNLITGITDVKNASGKVVITDPENPDILIQRTDNVARKKTYYISFNTYLNPFRWWQISMSASGYRSEIDIFDESRSINTFQGYMSWMFNLPKGIMLDLSGFYMSPFIDGSIKTEIDPEINLSLRKQFMDRKFSAKLFVNNLFDMGTAKVTSDEKNFQRTLYSQYSFRQIGFSLSYNFQIGKSIQVKNVETGAAEEKARLK